jgi:dienelactone hydrolase
MAEVVLFHSVYGLRPAEQAAAERLRAAGHRVVTPDLYGGRTTESIDEGFALREAIGWPAICERAAAAVAGLPAETVLAGVSMGAGVVGALWPFRPETAGVLLLHGTAELPSAPRPGVPLQLHVADPDAYEPADEVADWLGVALRRGIAAQVFRYPGAGHYFTDASLPDHDPAAAALAWQRALAFLAGL